MPRYFFRENVTGQALLLTHSDGDARFGPPLRPSYIDQDGNVNAFEPADAHTLDRWKTKIGNFLAQYILVRRDHTLYKLWSLPEGYTLWIHVTGPENDVRKDAYLYGSRLGHIFRSPAEFYLHAAWLILGGAAPRSRRSSSSSSLRSRSNPHLRSKSNQFASDPDDADVYMSTRSQCKCKYCFGTAQSEISRHYPMFIPTTSGGPAGRAEDSPRGVAAQLARIPDVLVPFKDYRHGESTNTGW